MKSLQEQEHEYLELKEREAQAQQANANLTQAQQGQQAFALQNEEQSIIKDQLDLTDELERINNLLRGNVLKPDGRGGKTWTKPKDPEMEVLSEYGIHLIMNTITFYINKNTLLSNYDEKTINDKMEDFATDLADTIFMEYEKVFQYPSSEQVQEKLVERLKRKQEDIISTAELRDEEYDKKKIWKKLINEINPTVERQKIKEQLIKNKLKRFMLLLRCVQDSVHSTYQRAWKGQERTTLRQHIHITESRGGNQFQPQNQKSSRINPLNWLKPK